MTNLLDWMRCRLTARCAERPADRRRLEELQARTRRAERQTTALRQARLRGQWPSWEELYGRDDGGRP